MENRRSRSCCATKQSLHCTRIAVSDYSSGLGIAKGGNTAAVVVNSSFILYFRFRLTRSSSAVVDQPAYRLFSNHSRGCMAFSWPLNSNQKRPRPPKSKVSILTLYSIYHNHVLGNAVMHDPMAMRPFMGYNFGKYLQHWIDLNKPGRKVGHESLRCMSYII